MAKEFKACCVESCNGNAHHSVHGARGLCPMHYKRLKRNGDVTVVRKPANGVAQQYYKDVVLTYDGADCLIWPYGKSNGYGNIHINGRSGPVSRYVCVDIYGPPPTPEHEAAHSCGNGDLGCVAKGHLRWATSVENKLDKIAHGTHTWGETHPSSKLSQSQVDEIIASKGEVTQRVIADKFNISQATVSRLHTGKTWERMEIFRA